MLARSLAGFLSIDTPTVESGVQAYPVLSTSVPASLKDESAAADETAAAFTVASVSPRRLTGAFLITKEDIAVLPELEPSLRENLSLKLNDAFNTLLMLGKSASPDVEGLADSVGAIAAAATGQETYARYLAAIYGYVDGTYVDEVTGIRQVVGSATYAHMGGVSDTNGSTPAAEWLSSRTGGVRASSKIAAVSSHQQVAVFRKDSLGRRAAVMPIWNGIEITRDPFSNSKKGQISVVGTLMAGGVQVLLSGAFVGRKYRVSS